MQKEHAIVGPAARYQHDHPPVSNVNEIQADRMTLGQRVADHVASAVGSWPFIIIQSLLLVSWMAANVYLAAMAHFHPAQARSWDPYPFILLNLVLSFQAAYTGPVVMMSQNRQSEKDRLVAQHDYDVDLAAEKELTVIMEHLVHQDHVLQEVLKRLDALEAANRRGRCQARPRPHPMD